jgi:hypothetical protein
VNTSRSSHLLGALAGLVALGLPLLILTGPVWLDRAHDAYNYRGTSLTSSIAIAIFVCAAIGFVLGTMLKPQRTLLLGAQFALFTAFAFLGAYLEGAIGWAVDPGCQVFFFELDDNGVRIPPRNTFPFWEESILHFLPRPQAQAVGLIAFIPAPLVAIASFFAIRAVPLQSSSRRNLWPAVAAIGIALAALFLSFLSGPNYLC